MLCHRSLLQITKLDPCNFYPCSRHYLKKSNSSSFRVFLFLFFNRLSYLPPVNSAPNCVTELYATFKSLSNTIGFSPYFFTHVAAVGRSVIWSKRSHKDHIPAARIHANTLISFNSPLLNKNPLIHPYCVSPPPLLKVLKAELNSIF